MEHPHSTSVAAGRLLGGNKHDTQPRISRLCGVRCGHADNRVGRQQGGGQGLLVPPGSGGRWPNWLHHRRWNVSQGMEGIAKQVPSEGYGTAVLSDDGAISAQEGTTGVSRGLLKTSNRSAVQLQAGRVSHRRETFAAAVPEWPTRGLSDAGGPIQGPSGQWDRAYTGLCLPEAGGA